MVHDFVQFLFLIIRVSSLTLVHILTVPVTPQFSILPHLYKVYVTPDPAQFVVHLTSHQRPVERFQ